MSRTVYYAPGGGLGHLTRGRRVLETLGIADAVIVGSDRHFAADTAKPFEFVPIPPRLQGDVRQHGAWIDAVLRDKETSRLIVDTFPAGIQGELGRANLQDIHVDYVGRLLRWDEYVAAAGKAPMCFKTSFVLEKLFSAHENYVADNSARIESLDLVPAVTREAGTPRIPGIQRYWVISHSGPEEEVSDLVAFAQDLRDIEFIDVEVVIATLHPPSHLPLNCSLADDPMSLYPGAAQIISGCGFNTMMETEPFREKHILHPFARRFDDQFERAARRRHAMREYAAPVVSRASHACGSVAASD